MGLTGAIIAGGKASRLGGLDKALIVLPQGGRIIDRSLALLREHCEQVLIGTNRPEIYDPGLWLVSDREPGRGPLEGLGAALAASQTEALLIVAGDMPALEGALLSLLVQRWAQAAEAPALLCRREGRLETFPAIVSSGALPAVERALAREQRSVWRCLAELPGMAVLEEEDWKRADPSGRSFLSINTELERRAFMEGSGADAAQGAPCST